MSYNVAPTQSVPVVRIAAHGERAGALMHWGLIPYWAKGVRGTADEAFAALKQYPDTHLAATPVSTRVNAPKNKDAKLIEPLAA